MGQILELVVKLKWVFVGLSGLLLLALIGAFVDKANSKKFKFAEDSKTTEIQGDASSEAPADANATPSTDGAAPAPDANDATAETANTSASSTPAEAPEVVPEAAPAATTTPENNTQTN